MTTIEITGRITETGELKAKLPPGLPPGEVRIRIELADAPAGSQNLPWEQRPWTEDELRELLTPRPAKTGAEIVAMLESGELDTSAWVEAGITDSVAWVEELRRKEEGRYKW